MNTKSVVLIIYGKINQQQKNTFIICKQLNGSVLKSLKPKRSGSKSKSTKMDGLGLGPGQYFIFCFGPGRARAEISNSLSGWAGLAPKF